MSNVIKMDAAMQAAAEKNIAKWITGANGTKKDLKGMGKWKERVEEQGNKLFDRMYDQIRLTEADAAEENIPEEFSDCSILAVISRLMVTFSASRNVLSPTALVKFVQYQIDLEMKELREYEEEEKE